MGVVTKSIGSAVGRDYSTIQSWIDALPADLVADGNSQVGECYNDSEFAPAGKITIGGHTTDATQNITLKCAAGHSFYDHASRATNQLKYDQSKGVGVLLPGVFSGYALEVTCPNTLIDGIQFRSSYGSFTVGVVVLNAANCTIRNCIARFTSTGNSPSVFCNLAGTNGSSFVNCISIVDGSANSQGFGPRSDTKVINCTAIYLGTGSAQGYARDYGSPLIRNCAAFGFAKFGKDTTAAAGSGYNATDLAAANTPGSNNVYSLVFADQFQDITNTSAMDFRVKAGSGLINAGTRDATYTNDLDIIKQARSATTPTIGAWEYIAAAIMRRALILAGGEYAQITDAQVGTGMKPLVLEGGLLKQRTAAEGTPVVLVNGSLRCLAAGETLLL